MAAAPDRRLFEWAQGQERAGQLEAAAQGYARAGAPEDAARVLLAAGKPAEAGRVLLASIGYDRRKTGSLDPSHRKIALKAAICLGKGGEVGQAVEVYQMLGEARLGRAGGALSMALPDQTVTGFDQWRPASEEE